MHMPSPKQIAYSEVSSEMIEKHRPLVRSILARSGLLGEPEDLIQEGMIGLLEALVRYDPARGTQFSTYAHVWIRKRMFDWTQDRGATIRIPKYLRKHRSPPETVMIDDLRYEPAAEPIKVEESLELARLLGMLPARTRRAIVLTYLEGRSQREVGRLLGLTGEAVRQIVNKGIAHLQSVVQMEGRNG